MVEQGRCDHGHAHPPLPVVLKSGRWTDRDWKLQTFWCPAETLFSGDVEEVPHSHSIEVHPVHAHNHGHRHRVQADVQSDTRNHRPLASRAAQAAVGVSETRSASSPTHTMRCTVHAPLVFKGRLFYSVPRKPRQLPKKSQDLPKASSKPTASLHQRIPEKKLEHLDDPKICPKNFQDYQDHRSICQTCGPSIKHYSCRPIELRTPVMYTID
ncbi:hypothetical protein V8F06_002968 [Rhypophila decipiens]